MPELTIDNFRPRQYLGYNYIVTSHNSVNLELTGEISKSIVVRLNEMNIEHAGIKLLIKMISYENSAQFKSHSLEMRLRSSVSRIINNQKKDCFLLNKNSFLSFETTQNCIDYLARLKSFFDYLNERINELMENSNVDSGNPILINPVLSGDLSPRLPR